MFALQAVVKLCLTGIYNVSVSSQHLGLPTVLGLWGALVFSEVVDTP